MIGSMDVTVSAWVKISDTSPIEYSVFPDGVIEFYVGDQDDLALVTTARGLRHVITHAEEALRAVQRVIAGAGETQHPQVDTDAR